MSSRYVRNMIESWLKDAAMSVPFYPTINVSEKPKDNMWCTVEFNTSYRETITFCQGQTEENGDAMITYYGLPGLGYDALIQALELDIQVLMSKRDPTQKMVLLDRSAPSEESGGSANKLYGLSVFVEYVYYE